MALTFGKVTTEFFVAATRVQAGAITLLLNVTELFVIALLLAAITLDVAHTTVINAVNTLFFIVIILIFL